MKKWMKAGIASLLVMSLTGCKGVMKLSEEQNNEAAEYIASVLLKRSSIYEQRLVYEQGAPTATPTATDALATEVPGGQSKDNENGSSGNTENVEFSNLLGLEKKKITLKYKGTKTCQEYRDSTISSAYMKAEKGKKLALVKFKMVNGSSTDQKIQLSDKKVSYTLQLKDGTQIKPVIALITNDLQFLDITLSAKKTKEVLLIFKVDSKDTISDALLTAAKGNKSSIITLK